MGIKARKYKFLFVKVNVINEKQKLNAISYFFSVPDCISNRNV